MNKKQKFGIAALLISPFAFVIVEWFQNIISFKLLIMLYALYLVVMPLLIIFVIMGIRRIE